MKVLALELSSSIGSVAFRDGVGAHDLKVFPADRKDSGLFFENLSALQEAHGPPELIVVGLGPGSYAGTRIAIATALGLRVASGARLLGLPSICAIEKKEYLVVGDARRNSYFFAHVADGTCLEGPTLATEAEVRTWRASWAQLPFIASQPLAQFAEVTVAHPSALRLAELALRSESELDEILEPIYLREPYITIAKK
ncbi:MAG: tRNA (adenosine(37)-N6)-threonylcarbamoyltransferase complex dimerization subunit type 1 TsaB [Spartobacteria bacterium]